MLDVWLLHNATGTIEKFNHLNYASYGSRQQLLPTLVRRWEERLPGNLHEKNSAT